MTSNTFSRSQGAAKHETPKRMKKFHCCNSSLNETTDEELMLSEVAEMLGSRGLPREGERRLLRIEERRWL